MLRALGAPRNGQRFDLPMEGGMSENSRSLTDMVALVDGDTERLAAAKATIDEVAKQGATGLGLFDKGAGGIRTTLNGLDLGGNEINYVGVRLRTRAVKGGW
jgi:hypothetical protein